MLNLDRNVITQRTKPPVQCFQNPARMSRPVKEIRITERDVLGARIHLCRNVLEHDLRLNHTKRPVVNRNNRAMSAAMLAATTRLGIPGDALTIDSHQLTVLAQWRQRRAIRSEKLQPLQRRARSSRRN